MMNNSKNRQFQDGKKEIQISCSLCDLNLYETIDKKQIKWRQVLQTQLRGIAFFPFPYLLIKGIMHLSFLPSF